MQNLYSTLGVSRTASKQEIKKAYRKLASELHPDKNPGAKNEQRFKDVTGAYQVLSDDQRRKLYDEFGSDSLRVGFDAERARAAKNFARGFGGGGFGGGGGNSVHFDLGDMFGGARGSAQPGGFGDMFGDLFGQRGGARARAGRPGKGTDIGSTVRIDFVDAVKGTTLTLNRSDGGKPVTVRIPAGAADGSKLRVRGKGSPGQLGGPAGDLVLTIAVNSHPYFERDGSDLRLDLPVTLKEAYAGAQVVVPTPHGDVKLKVPGGVQSGQKLRLRGKGVQRRNKPPGDLYVRFMVMIPTSDDPAVQEAIDVLDAHAGEPRADITF